MRCYERVMPQKTLKEEILRKTHKRYRKEDDILKKKRLSSEVIEKKMVGI
jgi:hypothetical protein